MSGTLSNFVIEKVMIDWETACTSFVNLSHFCYFKVVRFSIDIAQLMENPSSHFLLNASCITDSVKPSCLLTLNSLDIS